MPNRCGIIHARGPQPQNKITSTEIQEYIKNFETKMSQFLAGSAEVNIEELKKLGAKDIDAEVEKFISANSQELAKDKWLCPLSGKIYNLKFELLIPFRAEHVRFNGCRLIDLFQARNSRDPIIFASTS